MSQQPIHTAPTYMTSTQKCQQLPHFITELYDRFSTVFIFNIISPYCHLNVDGFKFISYVSMSSTYYRLINNINMHLQHYHQTLTHCHSLTTFTYSIEVGAYYVTKDHQRMRKARKNIPGGQQVNKHRLQIVETICHYSSKRFRRLKCI